MILLTMRQWLGPSNSTIHNPKSEAKEAEVKLKGFVTNLSLGDAIRAINQYEKAYNVKYRDVMAVNFELIQVSNIDQLTNEEISMARLELVESLNDIYK